MVPQGKIIKLIFLFLAVFLNYSTAGADDKWEETHSRHFFIYYKDAPADFVQNVEEAAENYYDEITRNLGFSRYEPWSYEERAKIYIYQDQQDYINSSQQYGWSHGAANARQKTIRTFPSAHGFFDSTLPHELGHIIFREMIGFYAEVPLWLDEGVAMFQEKAKRWGANTAVKQAMEQGSFLSLKQLSEIVLKQDTDPKMIDLFYAESASVVYFLITEFGQYRFQGFCQEIFFLVHV